MKIGISEAAARKTLAMIPGSTKDPDLQQLRTRIEQQLKATTAGGHLTDDELDAVIGAVIDAKANGSRSLTGMGIECLRTALPKLQALLDRQRAANEGGRR